MNYKKIFLIHKLYFFNLKTYKCINKKSFYLVGLRQTGDLGVSWRRGFGRTSYGKKCYNKYHWLLILSKIFDFLIIFKGQFIFQYCERCVMWSQLMLSAAYCDQIWKVLFLHIISFAKNAWSQSDHVMQLIHCVNHFKCNQNQYFNPSFTNIKFIYFFLTINKCRRAKTLNTNQVIEFRIATYNYIH